MRARNLKPGFFANEELAVCSAFARLLFAGLWCVADRAGRLEDRPKRIKAQIFPYDDVDADALLEELAARRFIQRYEAGGIRYIAVLNFDKHQHPHIKEAPSTIPAPDEHGTSTVQEQKSPGGFPITDSLIADSGLEPRARAREKAATPPPVEIETTPEEREIVAIIQRVPGLAAIPESEIVLHFREVLSCRDGPPLSFASLKAEAIKFRDYHTDRRGTATQGKWRGWQNALMNWFTRAKELPKHDIAAQNGHHDEPITADERRNAERDERLRAAQARGLIADAGRPTGTGGRVGLSAGSDGLP